MYHAFNKTLPVNLNNIFTVCEPNSLFNMRKKKDFVQKYTRTKGPFKCYVTLFFGNWTPTHPLVTLITLNITPS